jgi:hypothetical protein
MRVIKTHFKDIIFDSKNKVVAVKKYATHATKSHKSVELEPPYIYMVGDNYIGYHKLSNRYEVVTIRRNKGASKCHLANFANSNGAEGFLKYLLFSHYTYSELLEMAGLPKDPRYTDRPSFFEFENSNFEYPYNDMYAILDSDTSLKQLKMLQKRLSDFLSEK